MSAPKWNDRSCEDNEKPDFIADGETELILLDGGVNTCLPQLSFKQSFLRLNVYVYTPKTRRFSLNVTVADLACESPGIVVYYQQKCVGFDDGILLQCILNGSSSDGTQNGVISCYFACTSTFELQLKTRVIIEMEIFPWEMKDNIYPKICELATNIT